MERSTSNYSKEIIGDIMQIFRSTFITAFLVCATSLAASSTWASLESEQATLAQLGQALDEAKASLHAMEEDAKANQTKAEEDQKGVLEATTAKASAQASLDALTAQQNAKPNADTERKRKDAEYEVMMAERKLSSAQKALERAEKKLLEATDEQKGLRQQISQAEKALADQKALVEKIKTNASAQNAQAAQKATADTARKEAEARTAQLAAQQKAAEAAEEAAKQAAASAAQAKQQADAQAKQQALVKQLGVDLTNCQALPASPASSELTAVDVQLQAFALGELRRVNRLLEDKSGGEIAALSPAPVLSGSKLKPCDAAQWQALKFSYLGSGQYRAETPVLAGEQEFSVKGVIDPIRRTIPETDNGAVYVFFLDMKFEGRYKLSAYKKALFDQAPKE